MRRKKTIVPPCVTCGDCRHFRRDTEGRSYSCETGEYFLGFCELELTPDTKIKQFANKKRQCTEYEQRTQ